MNKEHIKKLLDEIASNAGAIEDNDTSIAIYKLIDILREMIRE